MKMQITPMLLYGKNFKCFHRYNLMFTKLF